jgi:hypothetical protein
MIGQIGKKLPGTNILVYLAALPVMKKEKLYDIDTWDRFGPGQGAVRSLRVKDEERVG